MTIQYSIIFAKIFENKEKGLSDYNSFNNEVNV